MTRTTGALVDVPNPVATLLPGRNPSYFTATGAMYNGDCDKLMQGMPAESVNLVLTSPPYPLVFKKEYGNVDADAYLGWLLPFVKQIRRVLTADGSFVLNLGGVWTKGAPVRSLFHYEVALAVAKEMPLAQEFFWYNPAKLPAPAEWVNVRRIRVKDSVEYVWWFGKTENPKADNRKVLKEYSKDMRRLVQRGLNATVRPSGHNITTKFASDRGGSIPPNLIRAGNNDSTSDYFTRCKSQGIKPHPARFPKEIPEFFMSFCTNRGDVVLDPFAGSNTTGWVAHGMRRKWVSIEVDESYARDSALRFPPEEVFSP